VFLPGELSIISLIDCVKQQKQGMIGRYGRSDDAQGGLQVLMTLVPYAILWWLSLRFGRTAGWVLVASVPLLTLF
jgi:hypothetical protein